MTDSQYIKLTNLLYSFIEDADGLRDIWSGKMKEDLIRSGVEISIHDDTIPDDTIPDDTIILPDGSMILPKGLIKMTLSNNIERTMKLMDECEDYSSYHLAFTLYKTMEKFVSSTSDLPAEWSGLFRPLRERCSKIMEIIKPSKKAQSRADANKKGKEDFKKKLLNSQAFIDAKPKKIDDQLDWKMRRLEDLAGWLYDSDLIPIVIDSSGEEVPQWRYADCVFTHKGKVVTKDKLISAWRRSRNKDPRFN